MRKGIGCQHPRLQRRAGLMGVAFGIQRPFRAFQPRLACCSTAGVGVVLSRVAHRQPVEAGFRAIHAGGAQGVGIVSGRFVALGKGRRGGFKHLRQTGKHIAEQARHAQGHVDAGTVQQRQWQNFKARHPVRPRIPHWRQPGQVQRHGKFLARCPHRGGAPEVHHQPARPVAVVLQMPAQQFFGQLDPLGMGIARRHRAGIDRVQIAPGRQHVRPPPIGRPGGPGSHPPPVQRRQQPRHFPRALPVDMQAVAELAFLDVADEAVDAGDRLGRGGIGRQAEVSAQAGSGGFFADGGNQAAAAGGVEAIGAGVFIEQPFEAVQRLGQGAGGHGRRQVAEGDRADPPFGLRRLAGVVDDERVDDRQRTGQRLGPARV